MGQSEQHDIIKLTRRIESLEAKVYGGNHIVDGNKKVAVHAPEPWMKEKVAKVWGVEEIHPTILMDKPDLNYLVISFWNNQKMDGYEQKSFAIKDGFEVISFQGFCKQHGISDKPDYVALTRFNWKVYKAEKWVGDSVITKVLNTNNWQPATEKEYQEQEAEKEPELKLNEEWDNKYHGGVVQGVYQEGAKDMAKAINDEIDNLIKKGYSHYEVVTWLRCKIKQGDLKPPTKCQ